jgi:hypothetical protein
MIGPMINPSQRWTWNSHRLDVDRRGASMKDIVQKTTFNETVNARGWPSSHAVAEPESA